MTTAIQTLLLGLGATLFMDAWAYVQKKAFNSPGLDYALLARWVAYSLKKKTIFQQNIRALPPVANEKTTGYVLHYLIGVVFAYAFIYWLVSPLWFEAVEPVSPIIFGLVTVLFPFCIMQPGFGIGFFASKTPNPTIARIKSLIAHFSFGLGLYVCALFL